jgi:hypothetical protein
MLSVVLPSNNQGMVPQRRLETATRAPRPGQPEIRIGRTGAPRTAQIRSGFGEPARILETPDATEVTGFNPGGHAAMGFLHSCVQTDVDAPIQSLRGCSTERRTPTRRFRPPEALRWPAVRGLAARARDTAGVPAKGISYSALLPSVGVIASRELRHVRRPACERDRSPRLATDL